MIPQTQPAIVHFINSAQVLEDLVDFVITPDATTLTEPAATFVGSFSDTYDLINCNPALPVSGSISIPNAVASPP